MGTVAGVEGKRAGVQGSTSQCRRTACRSKARVAAWVAGSPAQAKPGPGGDLQGRAGGDGDELGGGAAGAGVGAGRPLPLPTQVHMNVVLLWLEQALPFLLILFCFCGRPPRMASSVSASTLCLCATIAIERQPLCISLPPKGLHLLFLKETRSHGAP